MKIKLLTQSVFIFLISIFLVSCANTAQGPIAMFYHNTTAHYNAYFLGKERMKELETGLYNAEKNNFYRILSVYPKVDCTFVKANKDKLDKIIKNVSLVLQWHKPSHWMDDSYLVLGKVRYYDLDYENAMSTFKFINNKYKDDDVKHEALTWLMHTYMDKKEWRDARNMGDYLESQPMLPPNMGKLALANGHYYIQTNDYKSAYYKMKVGVQYIKPKSYRAKIYYILGQLAQKEGLDKEAYENYKMSARSSNQSSGYEMWFYATLNKYLLKELKNEKDIEKTFKYYRKMLKDIKNEDYKDKIYYDMATIELKRDRVDEAIDYYKKSAREGKKSTFVKSFAYLRMAEIYYDKRQDFENAKIYYDSTITFLEKDLAEYPKAFRRQKVLEDFVKQLKVIRLEDSLQKLARMDTASLSKLVDKWIAADIATELKEEKEAKKKANNILSFSDATLTNTFVGGNLSDKTSGTSANAGTNEKWLFYNQQMLEASKLDFIRKWGNRANEDNWRRQNKEKEEPIPTNTNTQDGFAGTTPNSTSKDSTQTAKAPKTANARKQSYYDKMPLDIVKMDTSKAQLSRALFRIGKIYDFNLEEYPNAIKSYQRFVNEFVENEKRPEALYAIYLVCKNKLPKDECSQKYGGILVNEYPTSIYAKLVLDPDYLQKSKLIGDQVKIQYRQAFELFEKDQFLLAQNLLEETLAKYPDNDFEDRLIVLKAMIIGKTQSINNYQDALKTFLKKYEKTSKLIPFATHLLTMADATAKKDSLGITTKRVSWNLDINFPHYYCVVVPSKNMLQDLIAKIDKYNTDFFTDQKLTIVQTEMADSTILLTVKEFPNPIPAKNYWDKQNGKSSPLRSYPNTDFNFFVISDKNYAIMNELKNYKSYKEFFQKNY